jgi:hypothetical protein
MQVEYRASMLNSHDVFIVCHKSSQFYIWCGKGSTGDERETAKKIVQIHKKEPEMVFEMQEKDEFWTALGGKQPYNNEKRLQQPNQSHMPRLFEISNVTGRINVQEVYQFAQDDLNPSEVMLLDAWDTLFIWLGAGKAI